MGIHPLSVNTKVNKMEATMGLVAKKVNAVLDKLDQFEVNSRQLSAKVRKISSAPGNEDEKRQQVQELVNDELKERDSK